VRSPRVPWRELALSLVAAALCVGLAEAWVRWRRVDLNPSATFRFHPAYGWTMEAGIRRPAPPGTADPSLPPGTGTHRLLFVGDSFTFAIEQAEGNGFPGLLAKRLAPRGVEARTLASGGWGTGQELIALRREGLAWHPQVVVLQVFPYNDLCNNTLGLADTCSRLDEHRPYFVLDGDRLRPTWLHPWRARGRNALRLLGLAENLWLWEGLMVEGETEAEFRERSEGWARANARAKGLEHSGNVYALMPDEEQPAVVREGWRVTEALFSAFHDELAAREIALVVVVVPFLRTLEGWDYFRRYHRAPLVADYATSRVERCFSRRGVPTLSLRRRLAESGEAPRVAFNRRNLHLSGVGHRRLAEWLEELLLSEGLLPPVDGAPEV
jgi:lysophospholipase L1-like esterase